MDRGLLFSSIKTRISSIIFVSHILSVFFFRCSLRVCAQARVLQSSTAWQWEPTSTARTIAAPLLLLWQCVFVGIKIKENHLNQRNLGQGWRSRVPLLFLLFLSKLIVSVTLSPAGPAWICVGCRDSYAKRCKN